MLLLISTLTHGFIYLLNILVFIHYIKQIKNIIIKLTDVPTNHVKPKHLQ